MACPSNLGSLMQMTSCTLQASAGSDCELWNIERGVGYLIPCSDSLITIQEHRAMFRGRMRGLMELTCSCSKQKQNTPVYDLSQLAKRKIPSQSHQIQDQNHAS